MYPPHKLLKKKDKKNKHWTRTESVSIRTFYKKRHFFSWQRSKDKPTLQNADHFSKAIFVLLYLFNNRHYSSVSDLGWKEYTRHIFFLPSSLISLESCSSKTWKRNWLHMFHIGNDNCQGKVLPLPC